MNVFRPFLLAWLCSLAILAHAQTPLEGTPITRRGDLPHTQGFVSRGDSAALLLNALGAKMNLAVVVSSKAQKKKVSGSFDLGNARRVLDQLSAETGLVWYSDNQTLYVYDAAETQNAIGQLRHASLATLRDFMRKAQLDATRYPLRGSATEGTFYVTGPPVYVQIVLNAARYLDQLYQGADLSTEHVEVLRLQHGFVHARRYGLRGKEHLVPGVADVLAGILGPGSVAGVIPAPPRPPVVSASGAEQGAPGGTWPAASGASTQALADTPAAQQSALSAVANDAGNGGGSTAPSATGLIVLAFPETNSLIVRGTLGQIQKVRSLVAEIDTPRRQIELSLWIIDIKKSELDRLGVNWSGEVGIGNKFGLGFNSGGSVSTLDGSRFLAAVSALSSQGNASVVSRPILLTQENVIAHFDSNQTFYAPLLGERTAALESITYGTLISVLPRISSASEIEMQLQIEDGSASGNGEVDGLPIVARTSIDTIARVPHQLSLLVGGYTRQAEEQGSTGIPGLRRIPWVGGLFRTRGKRSEQLVRVFLIQPRVLLDGRAGSGDPRAEYLPDIDVDVGQLLRRTRNTPPEAADGQPD